MADQGLFSDYKVEMWLAELNNCWAALHFDNPQVASAYASEVFGGAYIRKKMAMTAPASRSTWNVSAISWTGLPQVLLTHIGFWDKQYNGNLLGSAPLAEVKRILNGGTYALGAKQLALSFQNM
jgi:hypothetical protein